jgi:hypothetical protein
MKSVQESLLTDRQRYWLEHIQTGSVKYVSHF